MTTFTESYNQNPNQETVKKSREAVVWLKQKIREIPSMQSGTNRFRMGGLYFFVYDAKGKATLPYWDKFPLVIPIERYSDGFLGLNLHYLPPKVRARFMDKISILAVTDSNDEIARLRVSYDILSATKKYKEFRPCIKRYLTPHIRSRILAVQPGEWNHAVFLPVAQFQNESRKTVYKDSLQTIKNQ